MKIRFMALLMLLIVCSLSAKHRTDVFLNGAKDEAQKIALQNSIGKTLSEFNRAFFAKGKLSYNGLPIQPLAKKTLEEMWETKSFYCPEQRIVQNIINRSDGRVEVRGLPIIYDRKSTALQEDELVIVLSTLGQVEDIKIALEREKYLRMFEQVNTIKDKTLYEVVLNFVENYRTAYNRKDINFIDKVFSDDALIIVGRVLNKGESLPDNLGLNKLSVSKDVSYSRLNKSQYIRNLRASFVKNSFVRIEFSDFKVQRHPIHNHVFGVQMHQKWRSSTYNDDGYLFLVIDLKNLEEPLIWVRTWQPEKSVSAKEAFDLGDFVIE